MMSLPLSRFASPDGYVRHFFAASATAVLTTAAAAAQCSEWSPDFSAVGPSGRIQVQEVLDLGAGPRLIAGGGFQFAGTSNAPFLAAFDGTAWSGFGSGPSGAVRAIAVYDDGGGTALYAGGQGFLDRWDGAAWTSIATTGTVRTMAVFDDGAGPALFVGGSDLSAGGATGLELVRYNGTLTPAATVSPSNAAILALELHTDASGTWLYVGGSFDGIGGTSADRIARWDGTRFEAVGGGIGASAGSPQVAALESFVSASGTPELHVAGRFNEAGGVASPSWTRWREGAWSPVGGTQRVFDLAIRQEASGAFVHAGRSRRVDRFDGVSIMPLALDSAGNFETIAGFPAGGLDALYGSSANGGGWQRWDGQAWVQPTAGLGLDADLTDAITHDFGSGEELVVTSVSGAVLPGAISARFDGTEWRPVGGSELNGGGPGRLHSVGGELYILGDFLNGDEAIVSQLVGNEWMPVGPLQVFGAFLRDLSSYDSGSGAELIVSGKFDSLGAAGTVGVARWDGASWTSLGGGVTGGAFGENVSALVTWDDGSGDALYMGGLFAGAGGVPVNNVARWDGTAWSALGDGVMRLSSGSFSGSTINDAVVFDSPTGEQLIVTGTFDFAGGSPAASIAAWDGASWSPLGSGLTAAGQNAGAGFRIATGDHDGRGARLYVFGTFDSAGGVPANGAAIWDGSTWEALDFTGGTVFTAMEAEVNGERGVYAIGTFDSIGGVPSWNVGRLSDPCGAIVGSTGCTSTPNSTGQVARVRAAGSASVGADNLTLTAFGLPANRITLLVNGTAGAFDAAGDGALCVGGTLRRMYPAGASDGAGELTQAFDYGSPYAMGVMVGQRLHFQGFFRDFSGAAVGFNTTDAVSVVFQP